MNGAGNTLGAALLDMLEGYAGGRRLRSYRATGWHAQLRQLLEAGHRGSAAADKVGLDPTSATVRAWLAEQRVPSPSNRAAISRAYQQLGHDWPTEVEHDDQFITGWVCYGSDCRQRGPARPAPLWVGRTKSRHDWTALRDAWNRGGLDPGTLEALYVTDVLAAELGDAYPWTFPRAPYSVRS